jgi:hypothetical protein
MTATVRDRYRRSATLLNCERTRDNRKRVYLEISGLLSMSNLDGAAEIFEQTSLRVNERTKHGKLDWAILPNFERASPAREKKKTPKTNAIKRPRSMESAIDPPAASTCIAAGHWLQRAYRNIPATRK